MGHPCRPSSLEAEAGISQAKLHYEKVSQMTQGSVVVPLPDLLKERDIEKRKERDRVWILDAQSGSTLAGCWRLK